MSKNICVADACSLLFSAQIRLKDQYVFEWLLEKYEVQICSTVKFECFDKLQKHRVEISNSALFKRQLSDRTLAFDCSECLNYIEKYCEEAKIVGFATLDSGEKESIALALQLNAKFKKPVSILTDDFEAVEVFSNILREQKFGTVLSVPDFIISTFQVTPDLEENITKGALQSYYNMMTKAIHHRTFKRRMDLSCRSLWSNKCGIRCQ